MSAHLFLEWEDSMKITHIKRERDRRKTRVAAYCRVSTTLDTQEESFETQQNYYQNLIRNNDAWEFAGIYADEKSGTKAKNREGFQRMIQDALDGKVDLILVKSVSRFARNVVDSEAAIKKLKAGGVYVHFERENINTEDPTSSMILSLMAAIAQDESRSISENVKWGYRERFKRGEYNLGNNRILGYDCVDGKLVPNDDAFQVSYIFEQYIRGKSCIQIAKDLNQKGYTGLRNKPFSGPSIRYILQNESYVGDKLLQKQAPKNLLTKQPDAKQPFESNYLKDDHEGIVPREIWEQVQQMLRKPDTSMKPESNAHFLCGKLFCGSCGAPMRRKTLREYCRDGEAPINYRTWGCSERMKGRHGNGCKCGNIRENIILKEISEQLGWSWNGPEEFTVEQFRQTVKKVEAADHAVTVTTV
jgi:DNA invertase Pin-like site-specific DNA recombinase